MIIGKWRHFEVEKEWVFFSSPLLFAPMLQCSSQGKGGKDKEDNCSPSQLEAVLFSKDREILRLLENVQRLQFTLQEVQDSSASQLAGLEHELAYKTEAIEVSGAEKFQNVDDVNLFSSHSPVLNHQFLMSV